MIGLDWIGLVYAGAEVQQRLAGIGGFKEPTVLATEGAGFDHSFVHYKKRSAGRISPLLIHLPPT